MTIAYDFAMVRTRPFRSIHTILFETRLWLADWLDSNNGSDHPNKNNEMREKNLSYEVDAMRMTEILPGG